MNTTQLEWWRLRHRDLWADQNPGCQTGASGFDYVAHYTDADKVIDEKWTIELQQARQRFVQLLANHASRPS